MIERLIRKFIKNSENISDPAVRRDYRYFADCVGIFINLVLFLAKLFTGLIIRSAAVCADAWNNFSYVVRSLLRLVGVQFGKRREKEPEGVRKRNYMLAFIGAFFVIEAGFSYFSRAFTRLRHPVSVRYGISAVAVLAACMLLRTWISAVQIRIGRKITARQLVRDARAGRRDNVLTALALIAVLIDEFLNINTNFLASLIISLAVIWSGVMIAVDGVRPAVTEDADGALIGAVRARIREFSCVYGIGSVKTKFYGPGRRLIAARVKVSSEVEIEDSYRSVKEIEKIVGEEFGVRLLLHVDPVDTSDKEEREAVRVLESVMETMDERLSVDHFHLVHGRDFTNLIFDLYVPFDYDEIHTEMTVAEIESRLQEIDPNFACVIQARQLR